MQNLKAHKRDRIRKMINLVTLVRLPFTIVFLLFTKIYIVGERTNFGFYAIIISFIIMLTDYIDGKLARKYHSVSEIGQSLDVYSDFIYISSALILFNKYHIIPIYFTCIVIYKFLEFLLFSKILKRKTAGNKNGKYYYDRLGSIVSAAYYAVPTLQLFLLLFRFDNACIFMHNILLLISAVTFIASFNKIKYNISK
jgi:CDP-diacylglycerol--glycerol-3-phosphate 3-phosphatidyltransferase